MTPQLTPQPDTARNTHLTEDQFGELLSASTNAAVLPTSPAEAHLLACEECAAELASLRESLTLFRHASSAYADNQLRGLPQLSIPARPAHALTLEPAYWAAAAAILLAAFLPLQTLRQHPVQTAPPVAATVADRPAGSDEALLEDINREISASVPTPMQALADPTAGMAASVQNSTQRKD
jgi:hypothetical protein